VSLSFVSLWMAVSVQVAATPDQFVADSWLREARVPSGEKWCIGVPEIVGSYSESNNTLPIADFTFCFIYHLPDATDEDTYCSGEMLDDQAALMDPDSYSLAASVGGAIEIGEPRLASPVSRVGNVIEYEVAVPVVLDSVT
jgi:hypothetical protein